MRRPRLLLTRSDWLLLFVVVLAYTIPTLISIRLKWSDVTSQNLQLLVLSLLVFAVACSVIANAWQLNQMRGQLDRARSELTEEQQKRESLTIGQTLKFVTITLEQIAKGICQNQNYPLGHMRANVMLVNPKDQYLHITHRYNMDNATDRDISFAKGEGCCGRAWDTGQQAVADMTIPEQPYGPAWGLSTDKKKRQTEHLKSILSSPILHPDRENEFIGVLNVDSTEPLQLTR